MQSNDLKTEYRPNDNSSFSRAIRQWSLWAIVPVFVLGLVACSGKVMAGEPPTAVGRNAAETTSTTKKKKKPSFPGARKVTLKSQAVKAKDGKLKLHIELNLPKDTKLNPLAPMGFLLETVAKEGPVDRSTPSRYQKLSPPKKSFDLLIPVSGEGAERLRLSMNYYHCKGDPATGICKTGAVIWDIPIEVVSASAKVADSKDKVEIKYDVPKS